MNQRVRRNAFLFVLHASLAFYCLAVGNGFADDSLGLTTAQTQTADLVHVAAGAFGLCALFYGIALWLAYLDADDEKQARWEAERRSDDSVA